MTTHSYDDGRPPSYDGSIRESRSSFEFSDSESSVASTDLPQPPEKNIESRERVSTKTLLRAIMLPVFNILATIALIGIIILIYVRADGQPVDYKMAGLSVPTVLALVMTLVVLFISGGIGYAVSEYKWARFQSKAGKLALLDAYDACSRGVGGAIRAIPSLRMDLVLITTIIFYLGMVIIGPAAQGIIHTRTYDICEEDKSTEVYPLDISSEDFSTYDQSTKDPRSVKGVDDYTIVQYGFRQFLNLRPLQIMSACPKGTINCTYVNITLPRITADCTMGSVDTTRILDIYHNNLTNTRDYLTNYSPSIPAYFYSASMANRTYYDLNNLTLPYIPADKPPFNAEARLMIGDQTFVAVSSGNTMGRDWNSNFDKLQVRECTLRSTYDRTQLVDTQGEINITVLSSEPVDMDYDNIIGNNVFRSQYDGGNKKTNVMLNSYALQISFMRSLIINEQNVMLSMAGWSFDNVLQGLGTQVGFTYSVTGPKEMFLGLPASVTICRRTDVLFALDKGAYLPLALCLVIPLIWWVTQWVVSLYKVNGVSRGHSQVSLLVSGLTPAVHEKMRGTIHEDQYATMAAASKINVKFGERVSDGHPTFGLAEEINPIGVRRMSF